MLRVYCENGGEESRTGSCWERGRAVEGGRGSSDAARRCRLHVHPRKQQGGRDRSAPAGAGGAECGESPAAAGQAGGRVAGTGPRGSGAAAAAAARARRRFTSCPPRHTPPPSSSAATPLPARSALPPSIGAETKATGSGEPGRYPRTPGETGLAPRPSPALRGPSIRLPRRAPRCQTSENLPKTHRMNFLVPRIQDGDVSTAEAAGSKTFTLWPLPWPPSLRLHSRRRQKVASNARRMERVLLGTPGDGEKLGAPREPSPGFRRLRPRCGALRRRFRRAKGGRRSTASTVSPSHTAATPAGSRGLGSERGLGCRGGEWWGGVGPPTRGRAACLCLCFCRTPRPRAPPAVRPRGRYYLAGAVIAGLGSPRRPAACGAPAARRRHLLRSEFPGAETRSSPRPPPFPDPLLFLLLGFCFVLFLTCSGLNLVRGS